MEETLRLKPPFSLHRDRPEEGGGALLGLATSLIAQVEFDRRDVPAPSRSCRRGEPRRNFAVRNSSTQEPWLFRSPVFGSGIRRFDGDAVDEPPPREDPA